MIPISETSKPSFGRLITAMITPFKENGDVDYALASELAKHLVLNGSDAIVVCGTTGESPTLSWKEQNILLETVKNSVGSSAQIIAGTGSNSTSEAIIATKEAFNSGADGALVVTPYYNKPPQDGIEAHFREIALSAPELKLMLYNIPSRTGCSIKPQTVKKLMDCSNIVSFKAASGSVDEVTQLRLCCGPNLAIYSGDDGLLLPMLSVGAVGVVSVASHLVGRMLKDMIEAYIGGHCKLAINYHEKLQPLFKALFATTNPIPVKAALQLTGWEVGSPRKPLLPLGCEMREELSKIIQALALT